MSAGPVESQLPRITSTALIVARRRSNHQSEPLDVDPVWAGYIVMEKPTEDVQRGVSVTT